MSNKSLFSKVLLATAVLFSTVAFNVDYADASSKNGGKETKSGGKETKSGGKETKSGGKEAKSGGKEAKSGGKSTPTASPVATAAPCPTATPGTPSTPSAPPAVAGFGVEVQSWTEVPAPDLAG